jgi:hypothetical protein
MSVTKIKVSAKDYYDYLPSPPHKTGDIWTNLPTFGLLKQRFCSGVIITPACDLVNSKTETISYLPIIRIEEWFYHRQFYTEVKKQLVKTFQKNGILNFLDAFPRRTLPDGETIIEAKKRLEGMSTSTVYKKILLGLDHISALQQNNNIIDLKKLSSFFGKEDWQKICVGVIKNSLHGDIHFLPADGQNKLYSGIQKHSVVLFRYPLTIPIRILDLADDPYVAEWEASLKCLHYDYELSGFFINKPLRTSRLKKDFLTELLTRYLALYIRMGSPDFSDETVKSYSSEIGGV